MMLRGYLCVLVLFGALALALSDCPKPKGCCCFNGGKRVTDKNNCCRCKCPRQYSGAYCQKRSRTRTIAKWTYKRGKNPFWHLLYSSRVKGHPPRKSLRRKRQNDPFDMYFTFKKGDKKPLYTLKFRGKGRKKLHFLKGQFWNSRDATYPKKKFVRITGYDGAKKRFFKKIPLVNVKVYQNWHIKINKFVTRVEFAFEPCHCVDCYGINDVQGRYTIQTVDAPTCSKVPCPDNGTAVFKYGCCNCPVVCKNELDVVLILDRSGSMRKQYSTLKKVVKLIIHRFNVNAGKDATHIAAIMYNHKAQKAFGLKEHDTFKKYEAAIDAFPRATGTTNIAGALEAARALLKKDGRKNVPNACLLLTDGKPNKRKKDTLPQAELLKKHCKRVVSVGVGNNINTNNLKKIATNEQYIHSNNVEELKLVLDELITLLCASK